MKLAELATNEDSKTHEYGASSPEWGAHWRGWLAGYEQARADAVANFEQYGMLARANEMRRLGDEEVGDES